MVRSFPAASLSSEEWIVQTKTDCVFTQICGTRINWSSRGWIRIIEMMREWLLRLPRRYKRLLQVTVDVMLVWIALWLAFVVRLGTDELVHPLGGMPGCSQWRQFWQFLSM